MAGTLEELSLNEVLHWGQRRAAGRAPHFFRGMYGLRYQDDFFFLVANLNLFSLCVQPKVGFYGQNAKASPAAVSKGRAGSTSPLGEVTLR